jgi:glucosamine--fructose-6-phosphate aminotransferase (isomerizing)|tara:strand:+ start:1495 stop:1680 length:186 start_codon:yes stop_codon:yes gene_type:complete
LKELRAAGRHFTSETDSGVAAYLVSREAEGGASPEAAVRTKLRRLRGAFALAIAFRAIPTC